MREKLQEAASQAVIEAPRRDAVAKIQGQVRLDRVLEAKATSVAENGALRPFAKEDLGDRDPVPLAMSALRERDFPKAEELLKACSTATLESGLCAGWLEVLRNDLDLAFKHCKATQKLDEKDPRPLFFMALIHEIEGKAGKAKEATTRRYREAQQLDRSANKLKLLEKSAWLDIGAQPSNPWSYIYLSVLYREAGPVQRVREATRSLSLSSTCNSLSLF